MVDKLQRTNVRSSKYSVIMLYAYTQVHINIYIYISIKFYIRLYAHIYRIYIFVY